MQSITITEHLPTLAPRLAKFRTENSASHIRLNFRDTELSPTGLAMVSSWALEMIQSGKTITYTANARNAGRLSLMGFDRMLNPSIPIKPSPSNVFIPLTAVHDANDQMAALDLLCEMVLKQFSNAREFLPAFEWAVNEVTDNVFTHSQSTTPCVIAAQYYPANKQLEVAIVDQGVGLLGTLGPSHGAQDEREAIDFALRRGITRDPKIGQGNGLAGTERITEVNKGEMIVWTGTTTLVKSEERHYHSFSACNGVGIALRLNVEAPVDLSTTWIGERPYTYIDKRASELEQHNVIVVANECESVGSRQPARRFRNKLIALLPDVDTPIILDFKGCRDPSSSFLDELFGRLIGEIGLNSYHAKIHIEGLKTSDMDRANVVIHQRLQLMNDERDKLDYV